MNREPIIMTRPATFVRIKEAPQPSINYGKTKAQIHVDRKQEKIDCVVDTIGDIFLWIFVSCLELFSMICYAVAIAMAIGLINKP